MEGTLHIAKGGARVWQWSCMNGLAYTQWGSDYTAWSRVFLDTGAHNREAG